MPAGPDTPTTYAGKAELARRVDYLIIAHMAMTDAARTVTGEDTTVLTTYLATGWAKRQALANEIIAAASKIEDTGRGNPPDVVQRLWTTTCANWDQDRDPAVSTDLGNQISVSWDDTALIVKADKA